MLEGSDLFVMNLGILPPASLLVAILHSTLAPFPCSVTFSTETYLPRTRDFSVPCFSRHLSWTNGMDTERQSESPSTDSLFINDRCPAVASISLHMRSTTNVLGFVGAGVTYVKRQTSPT